jgi:hypothetical protein
VCSYAKEKRAPHNWGQAGSQTLQVPVLWKAFKSRTSETAHTHCACRRLPLLLCPGPPSGVLLLCAPLAPLASWWLCPQGATAGQRGRMDAQTPFLQPLGSVTSPCPFLFQPSQWLKALLMVSQLQCLSLPNMYASYFLLVSVTQPRD